MTSTDEIGDLGRHYPNRRLEICPSRFCRFSIRKRMTIQMLANLGPAVVAALFAVAEPTLRGYGLPDRMIEVIVLLALGALWFSWIVLRGGGRMAMDVIALLESGLTGAHTRVDFEPVFDRANARAQLEAFLDELERDHYTGVVPIHYKNGEPRRIAATEELDLSLPAPLGERESKEGRPQPR